MGRENTVEQRVEIIDGVMQRIADGEVVDRAVIDRLLAFGPVADAPQLIDHVVLDLRHEGLVRRGLELGVADEERAERGELDAVALPIARSIRAHAAVGAGVAQRDIAQIALRQIAHESRHLLARRRAQIMARHIIRKYERSELRVVDRIDALRTGRQRIDQAFFALDQPALAHREDVEPRIERDIEHGEIAVIAGHPEGERQSQHARPVLRHLEIGRAQRALDMDCGFGLRLEGEKMVGLRNDRHPFRGRPRGGDRADGIGRYEGEIRVSRRLTCAAHENEKRRRRQATSDHDSS